MLTPITPFSDGVWQVWSVRGLYGPKLRLVLYITISHLRLLLKHHAFLHKRKVYGNWEDHRTESVHCAITGPCLHMRHRLQHVDCTDAEDLPGNFTIS